LNAAEESARHAGDEHDKLVVTEEHLNDDHSIIDEAGVIAAETQPARTDGVTHLSSAGPAFIVQSGKSRLVQLDRPVRRVSVGDPEVAEIILVSPRDILINGRRPGDTSLILWDQHGVTEVHTISVEEMSDRQVLLEVTIAELNRTAMEQHGIDYRVLRTDFGLVFQPAKIAPLLGQFPPQQNQPLFPFQTGENVTLGVLDPQSGVAAFLQFIQNEGLGKILARPRIVARSGREAKFLSGGEIPIVIAEALQTSVTFKEFGTRVRFKPTVLADDSIDLEVAPEVSEPDFANGVNLFGFRVPAFVARRADTRVILRDGETLVIAGLFNDKREENEQKIPYLGDVPLMGYLFRHTTYTRTKNELMIVVRPKLADGVPPGVSVAVPDRGPLRREDVRTQATDAPVTRPRASQPLPADKAATTGDTRSTPSTPVEPGVRTREHGWSVQVAATPNAAEADTLVAALREHGFPAYDVAIQRDWQALYRVRVGPYRSMEEAAKQAARIRREPGVREAIVVAD
jgi:pilus assembly protein CpaC